MATCGALIFGARGGLVAGAGALTLAHDDGGLLLGDVVLADVLGLVKEADARAGGLVYASRGA